MDQLAFDLLLFIHEADTCALIVRIEERVDDNSLPTVQSGVLRCLVEEVIHGKVPVASHVSIPFSRMQHLAARAKASVNHWNALPLEIGDRLLIVGKPGDGDKFRALSGNQLVSRTDAAVTGLRECYRIQAIEKGSSEHKRALRLGLVGSNPLTRRYALESISRHEVVPREVGCAMIVDALKTEEPDRESLLRFADTLSSLPFFDEEQQVDDVNQAVVVSIVGIVDRLARREDQVTCVRYLASCILATFDSDPSKDTKSRSGLLRAIGSEPPKALSETMATMSTSPSPDDKAIVEDLRKAWLDVR